MRPAEFVRRITYTPRDVPQLGSALSLGEPQGRSGIFDSTTLLPQFDDNIEAHWVAIRTGKDPTSHYDTARRAYTMQKFNHLKVRPVTLATQTHLDNDGPRPL